MTTVIETRPTVDDIVAALVRDAGSIDLHGNEARLFIQVVRRVAEGQPVTDRDVTDIAAGLGLSKTEADAVLNWVAERNDSGDIVGIAGLSQNQWSHGFRVNGHDLTTWCALDTLYLPLLLRGEALITSKDPGNEAAITIETDEEGVVRAPDGAVISIVVPKTDQKGLESAEQIWSAFCSYSHYFTSIESGREWFEGKHVEPIFLSIEEGFELGRQWFAQVIQFA
jgi:alkylmercury lyase